MGKLIFHLVKIMQIKLSCRQSTSKSCNSKNKTKASCIKTIDKKGIVSKRKDASIFDPSKRERERQRVIKNEFIGKSFENCSVLIINSFGTIYFVISKYIYIYGTLMNITFHIIFYLIFSKKAIMSVY